MTANDSSTTRADREGGVFETVKNLGLLDPARLVATGAALARWGPNIASLYAAAAGRFPTRPAIIDHRGSLSYVALDRRSTALAKGLLGIGLRPGQNLGLLCHNHRDFVEANVAAAKAGLDVVYLNTGFAPPQLAEVLDREQVAGVVCDADLFPLLDAPGSDRPTVVADGKVDGLRSMHDVRRTGRRRPRVLVPRTSSPVLLTSGTTGLPKGAQRSNNPAGARSATGLLQRIPYRAGDVFVVASPLFHAWGLSQLIVAASLGSTVVLSPRFSPSGCVDAVAEHRATVLTVVPVMLQRMLSETAVDLGRMSGLRIVASSGAALPPVVALDWMDQVGDTLYNLYGSTEVGQAAIATPDELRAAPGTVGRVAPGSNVAILDDRGRPLPQGSTGQIFVSNGAQFAGYTGGGGKEVVDGYMSSGDVGYFSDDGLLFVTGRADDMIISGGENVFPGEVEDLLLAMDDVADVAVVGVEDADFGQRLAAFIVAAEGTELTVEQIRSAVGDRLARHKVPRDVTFVDELPRTTTGKVLRRSLGD